MLSITGHTASIYWGYREVAAVSAWSVSSQGSSVATFTGTLERGDAFALTQQGLEVRIPRPKGQPWRWPVESLHLADRTVSATVRLADKD
jgi:hypothetical protein